MPEQDERLTLLFHRHAGDIHAYAAWRVGQHDAADVVGEVFLIAWRSLDRIRPGEERPWLFGVARKVVLARHRQGAASTALGQRLAGAADIPAEPDELADDVALRDQVRRALDALGERDREVLVTAAWCDLSPAEAAQVLGISRPAYAVRLHRARRRFRVVFGQVAQPGEDATAPIRNPLAV
jgi:RNA polymerase sigma-70 factor (ECF subfamily)